MPRWKALPEELGPEFSRFVVGLRQAKDRSGLSVAGLAAKTGYSVASWERYLHGRVLPPPAVLQALTGILGADADRLLVLRELAEQEIRNAAGARDSAELRENDPAPSPAAESRTGWRRRAAVVTAVVVVAAAAVLAITRPWQGGTVSDSRHSASGSYGCHYSRTGGLWFAGNSTTRTDLVQLGMEGPEVAEVQCLLQRAGDSPQTIDGIFGPLTERAVRLAQQHGNVGVDGIVGPQTWKVLRG